MKRIGLLLSFLLVFTWLGAQVVENDSLKGNGNLQGDLFDLLNDLDLQPMDGPLTRMDVVKADSLRADSIRRVKLLTDSLLTDSLRRIQFMADSSRLALSYNNVSAGGDSLLVDSLGVDSLRTDSLSRTQADSLHTPGMPLYGMNIIMLEPKKVDSLRSAGTLDSLYAAQEVRDSLIMDKLVLDSTVIDTLTFDSAYYLKQQQMVRDSLRKDSIRLHKLAAEKRRLMIPQSIRDFTKMLADYRNEFDDLFVTDYYKLYEGVRMRPEFYKYVVPMTYYQSAIREAGSLGDWQPEDKYTAQAKRRKEEMDEMVPDMRTSLPYYEAVESQMLHFYVNYPKLVRRNEADFANISVRTDKELEAAPRTENVLNMIGSYNTVQQVTESDLTVLRPNFWTKGGSGYLHFSQNHISDNWYKGGESTKSLLSGLVLYANYNDKHRVQFENKLEWKLGFITAPSDTVHSYKANNDLFRLTSKMGLKAINRWYYTLSLDFKTQLFSSYQTNTDNIVSAFFSPAELNVGLGMDFKYSKDGICNLSVLMNPFNYTLYSVLDNRVDPTKFNIEKGHKHANVFGSRFDLNLKWKVFKPLMWESRLSYTTNYEKALAEWENTFTFVVNKYLSTKLFVIGRFDDGVTRKEGSSYFQIQEILSFGLNYAW